MNKTPPTPSTAIDYNLFTKNALRRVVRDALTQVARYGLPGAHHFYISFDTHHEGTVVPDFLRAAYPRQMSIVLQHRFSDLQVGEEGFSVTLSFRNQPHRLTIPYAAILDFTDPAASFHLRFPRDKEEEDKPEGSEDGKRDAAQTAETAEEDSDSRVVRVDFPRRGAKAEQPESSGEG